MSNNTKQWRMVTELIKAVDNVLNGFDIKGGVEFSNNSGEFEIVVNFFDKKGYIIYEKRVVRGKQSYSKWVNEVMYLKRDVLLFGNDQYKEEQEEWDWD